MRRCQYYSNLLRLSFRHNLSTNFTTVYSSTSIYAFNQERYYVDGLEDDLKNTMAGSVLVGKLLSKKPNLGQLQTHKPTDTLYDAAKTMASRSIGSAIVTEDNSKCLGIVTERDYMKHTLERGDAKKIIVKDIMTPVEKMFFVEKTDKLDKCMELMSEKKN